MRIRLPMGRTAFFLGAFAFALLALLPLRLAADWFGFAARGLVAREATGSIWFGGLREAQLGPVPVGDVTARLNSLPLLLGRARVSLRRDDEANPFRGAITLSRHAFGVDDATGQLRVGALFAPLPVAMIEADDVSAGFANGQCARAEGNVRATLAGEVAGIGLPSGFAGTASCAGDAVLLPLASQTGMERLELRLFADGRFRADLSIRPTDEALRGRLVAAGFQEANGLALRRIDGRF
ncbi:type II secretion system protein N [Sphingosinicella sp. LHD-64]|uniref:type II secretion system protein N n=1 Tax=Sphingosinicella sp. LHD-64 TaxID=3072139 RepID=UPI00281089FB|nr:type II secretion system protein N [Sphingosinicella sp. LHD-64]MDQ8755661.1 type II secretion system protein N [Sphingosinicella sp. LHD-64]